MVQGIFPGYVHLEIIMCKVFLLLLYSPYHTKLYSICSKAIWSYLSPLPLPPPVLRYGSTFSLRSVELSCWLHSHNHTYPLKYPDGRGSSFQQQVTCYDFRDQNNLWAIRKPGRWVWSLVLYGSREMYSRR